MAVGSSVICSILASFQNSKLEKTQSFFLSFFDFFIFILDEDAGPMRKFCATEKPPTGDRLSRTAVVLVCHTAA